MQWTPLVLKAAVPEQLIKNYNLGKEVKTKSEPPLLEQ